MADDLSDITDDELVRRAARGDQSAGAALADRHLASVVAFAWYRLGDRVEAQDIVQETLLRVREKSPDMGARRRKGPYMALSRGWQSRDRPSARA